MNVLGVLFDSKLHWAYQISNILIDFCSLRALLNSNIVTSLCMQQSKSGFGLLKGE